MSLKPYYFILLIIFLSSSASVVLLYYYLDPETDPRVAFGLMAASLFLTGSSLLSLILFFLKKVYYRGEVYLSTMSASIRQSILLTSGLVMMGLLYGLTLFEPKLIMMVWAALACLEIMIQAIE